jgi:hypothetical protein
VAASSSPTRAIPRPPGARAMERFATPRNLPGRAVRQTVTTTKASGGISEGLAQWDHAELHRESESRGPSLGGGELPRPSSPLGANPIRGPR